MQRPFTIYFDAVGHRLRILRKDPDAVRLDARAEEIRAAFKHEFFAPSGRIAHNDQTSWALAFLYDPPRYETAGRDYFRRVSEETDSVIGTGFIGTPLLWRSRLGMLDLAEKDVPEPQSPRLAVPGGARGDLDLGAVEDALAEDGTIYDPDMNSYNHYAYGAVCQ